VNLRWTVGLLALAAALGAWVYFGEIRGVERKKEAEATANRIFSVETAKVSALEFSLGDGKTARVVRSGASDWKLESPVAYPADDETVERALHALAKVQATWTISPAPADLAPFGLGDGRHVVRVFTGEGEPKQIFIGGPTPVGSAKYVALASDPTRVFMVLSGDLYGLVPTLVELRDKRVLRIATGGADELTVRAHGELVAHLKKSDSGWQLVEPETAPADAEKIRRTLEELALARATDFADAPEKAESEALAKPAVEVVVHTPDAEERLALAEADGKTWLRREGDPVLLAVNPGVLSGVPTRTFDYRAKRVLTLESDKVHGLELAYPRSGETHRFELSGSDWKAAEKGVELKPLKVEDLVFAVASLDATGIEAAGADRRSLGLDPPVVTVRALDDKGAELGVLSLGDASVEKGIPAASSQNGDVWRVSNDLGKQVPLSPEAFANQFVKKSAAPAAAPAAAPGAAKP
jgi:Domain of unknown function (DUF4340)